MHTQLSVLGVGFAGALQYLVNSGTPQQPEEGEQALQGARAGEGGASSITGMGPRGLGSPPDPTDSRQAGTSSHSLIKVSLQLHNPRASDGPQPRVLH